jgi:hypothetical protein
LQKVTVSRFGIKVVEGSIRTVDTSLKLLLNKSGRTVTTNPLKTEAEQTAETSWYLIAYNEQ